MHSTQQQVGKYTLGKVLGSGDFDCRIRLCRHVTSNAEYAVKIYSKDVLKEAQWIWDQLAEAIQVMRTLPKNERIIEMVECFETETSLYILMPFVQGVSIYRLFNEIKNSKNAQLAKAASQAGTGATSSHHYSHTGPRAPNTGISSTASSPKGADGHSPAESIRSTIDSLGTGSPHDQAFAQQNQQRHNQSYRARRYSTRTADSGEDIVSHHARSGVGFQQQNTSADGSVTPGSPPGLEGSSHVKLVTIEQKRHMFEQVLTGVQHMHSHKVAHLGLAPDHIMCAETQGGRHKIKIGFLVACRRINDGEMLKRVTGTTATVAPEILQQQKGFDPFAADVWSLGCVLYYILSDGRYPFDGANTSKHILEFNIRPLSSDIPAPARDLVSRMLERDPTKRITLSEALKHTWIRAGRKDPRRICRWDAKNGKYILTLPAGLSRHERAATILQSVWRESRMRKDREQRKIEQQQQLLQSAGGGELVDPALGVFQVSILGETALGQSNAGGTAAAESMRRESVARKIGYKLPTELYTKRRCEECGRLPPPKVVGNRPIFKDTPFKYVDGKFVRIHEEVKVEAAIEGGNYVSA